jgi:sugar phosphate isomerase/epimerase
MPEVALQIWSVRDAYDADPAGTVRRIAEMGYPGVEMVYGRTGGMTHDAQRALLDEVELRAAAMHCFGQDLDEDLQGVMDAADTFGVEEVVCAWVDPDRRDSEAAFRALADQLHEVGVRMRERGLQLCYHHHDFELAEVAPGVRGMDLLWEGVPADLLKAEVDVYWVYAAGLDIPAYLEGLGERCVLLHVKDHLPDGAPPLSEPGEGLARFNTEIGAGVIDIPAALAAAPHARWVVVEQDFSSGDPFDSARISLANLRGLLPA